MKIRKKITLWISGTALLSTIMFSVYIFSELMEEPFKLIDNELKHMVDSIGIRKDEKDQIKIDLSHLPYDPDQYWIIVSDPKGNPLYQSAVTRYTKIPLSTEKNRYLIERRIPKDQIRLGQDDHDDVLFRVRVMEKQSGSLTVTVRIAKPIEDIEIELQNLFYKILIGLSICILSILIISYTLAGKILGPIVTITRMSTEISEESLNNRIPLNQNKDELYDLSVSLNRMFDRLQYSFSRQKEFIGNASHELKSPITLLMLAQEEMLLNQKLPQFVHKDLNRQLNITRRMSQLVRNLLGLSRLEQQRKLVRKPVNLTTLLAGVLEDYADLFAEKKITIENKVTENLIINGDPEKLQRLFINLIENSIRYNFKTDGVIIITGKQKNKTLLIHLFNSGKPIPEADIAYLFDQFFRSEKSRSASHGGSGLGLTIVRKIVEIHDGTIRISNESDNLIKVSLCFPTPA